MMNNTYIVTLKCTSDSSLKHCFKHRKRISDRSEYWQIIVVLICHDGPMKMTRRMLRHDATDIT